MKRTIRRPLAIALILLGALLLFLAPQSGVGLAVLILGAVIEIAGLAMERRDN